MKKNNLFLGAMILSVGGLLAKAFSAIYRIGLTRILGGTGIGIYQLIFPIYSLFIVLSTAGLPMAVSKIVAKYKGNEKVVFKKCMKYILFVCFILSLVLVILSKFFASLQHHKEIAVCYLILAPTLILIGASSVYKGYFQGVKNFNPSAISNIIEQFVKLILGLLLSLSFINFGVVPAIIGAMVAIIISEVFSYLWLHICFKRQTKKDIKRSEKVDLSFKSILSDIFPITLTNLILPVSAFIDSLLVINLLKFNFSTDVSVYLYGLESGAVSSLVNIPTIFSFAFATALMPSICECVNKINKKNCFNLTAKITLIVVIPCVLLFIFFPNQILQVLYGQRISDFGFDGINIASKLMILSSFGIVGLTINQVFSSSLQANNFRRITVVNMTIAVGVKFIFEILFMPFKIINIYALAISNTICYILVAFLNYQKLKGFSPIKFNYDFVGKLMLANIIMLVVILTVLLIDYSVLNMVFAFVLGAMVYLYLILNLNILNRKEKAMLKFKL